jgi:hypothetical protein
MKKTLFSMALCAMIFATGAFALNLSNEVEVAPGECGLNARQAAAGWICTAEVDTDFISREIGGGSRCQDAEITTTIFRAYNPSGNIAEDKTVVSEPEEADWGPSYAKPAGGCTYPTS